MAKIFPFPAYRYSSKAGSISELVTQPYDKISPEMQEGYYSASPHNVIRLIKGKEEASDNDSNNVYTRAAATLQDWIASGVLEQEPEPALFPYFQQFGHPETGKPFLRKGFIGLTHALDYSAGIVHGHELTHSGPKLDRLQLTRHTRAHFGQLFMLYNDPESVIDAALERAAAGAPLISVGDEFGVTHTVWRIIDPAEIAEIQAAMETKKLLVADGHHRYETALAYAKENPGIPGADKVMMTFVNMSAPGLVVLATHRVLGALPGFDTHAILSKAAEFFDIERLDSAAGLQQRLEDTAGDRCAIGVVFQGNSHCMLRGKKKAIDAALSSLTPKERGLDVVVLHKLLLAKVLGVSEEDVKELKHIRYIRRAQSAVSEVQNGSAQVAFLAAARECPRRGGNFVCGRRDAPKVDRLLSQTAGGLDYLPIWMNNAQISHRAPMAENIATSTRLALGVKWRSISFLPRSASISTLRKFGGTSLDVLNRRS